MIRFRHHQLLNLTVFCVLSVCGAFGQSIQGRITDNTGAGIAGVPVVVLNTETDTTTDSTGAYRVQLAPGSYTLRFGFDRFDVDNVSVVLTDDIPVTVDVNLSEEHSRLSKVYGMPLPEPRRQTTNEIDPDYRFPDSRMNTCSESFSRHVNQQDKRGDQRPRQKRGVTEKPDE
ncbi:carboxypeptidase-like regulatory domain-containing protein [Spirosoma koreense]